MRRSSPEPVTSAQERLFVALDLPEAVRGALARWAGALASADPSLRAVRADSMHVTLCFLGERPATEIDGIGTACAEAVRPPRFELSTGGVLGLPPDRPRVLAAGIEDRSRGLYRLQARLAIALAEVGAYRPERRPFLPHVTLGRYTGARAGRTELPVAASGQRGRAGQRLLAPVPFTASSVTLYRSSPSPNGQVYEPLRSAFLDSPL